jgi:hypothetical protein
LLGRKLINEYSFRSGDVVLVDLSGLIRGAGPYTIAIQGAGVAGASCNFAVSSQDTASASTGGAPATALRIDSVEPDEIPAGGTITLHGSGFSDQKSKNTVTIYNRPCTVNKATTTELQVATPSGLAVHSYTVDVTVNGVKSNTQKFVVTGTPELSSSSMLGFVPGSQIELTGNNFSKIASKNIVTVEVLDVKKTASVSSATKNSLMITVPDFPELGERLNGGINTPGTVTVEVAGVKCSGGLSIILSLHPMVR